MNDAQRTNNDREKRQPIRVIRHDHKGVEVDAVDRRVDTTNL